MVIGRTPGTIPVTTVPWVSGGGGGLKCHPHPQREIGRTLRTCTQACYEGYEMLRIQIEGGAGTDRVSLSIVFLGLSSL